MQTADDEIRQGKRFSFGRNWSSFLTTLDESRIAVAIRSLQDLLRVEDLAGKSFLDIGCGSGIFSLAARRLGARVHSFDYDSASVACTRNLRERFLSDDNQWTIEQGSALNEDYLRSLGTFDVVYSWGVLHHTGDLWRALGLLPGLLTPGGKLAIAIYNDQGWKSRGWLRVKQLYCKNSAGRAVVLAVFIPWFCLRTIAVSVIRGQNEFAAYRRHRGMSILHDWIDWLGGLPFEVAGFDQVVDFFRERGFVLVNSKRTRRLGCNEFVFEQAHRSSSES